MRSQSLTQIQKNRRTLIEKEERVSIQNKIATIQNKVGTKFLILENPE